MFQANVSGSKARVEGVVKWQVPHDKGEESVKVTKISHPPYFCFGVRIFKSEIWKSPEGFPRGTAVKNPLQCRR